ncbi:MAG: class I SAM-dependent methyltransferase [Cyclobacteriaceae bacterium]|nr:class I SAM-dependent methyltransferase [Cyclobacteriaceae bacterium]
MHIDELKQNWDEFGKKDPLWSILTHPDKIGNKWNPEDFFKTGRKEIEGVWQYINSLNIKINTNRALDFGCGIGRLTQALSSYFAKVDGVDIAPSMIRQANEYNKHQSICSYHVNDKDNLQLFLDSTYDFIYSNIVLQHMDPVYAKKYIKEFYRLLTHSGVLVFQVPSHKKNRIVNKNIFERIKLMIKASWLSKKRYTTYSVNYGDNENLVMEMNAMKRSELIRYLKEIGFSIIDIQPDHSTGNNWISYRYCVRK